MHADLADRRTRVAASWIVALVVTTVAAALHTLAGGATPHPVALLAALLGSGFLGMLVVARRRAGRATRLGIAAAVAVDQAIAHLVFSTLGTSSLGSAADVGLHEHLALGGPGLPAALAPVAEAPAAWMGAHHAVAAVIAYGMLLRGTAAVTAALAALGLLLARLLAPPPAPAPLAMRRSAPAAATAAPSPAVVVLGGIGRRGPPAPALAR